MNFSAASTFADIGHTSQASPEGGIAQMRALLVFHLGDRSYGLAVEHVVQIIAMVKLTPVPQSDQVVEGVANIRGKIVPVLSARRHLGLPMVKPQLYTPIILLNAGDRMIGLIVDEVADVVRLPAHQMTGSNNILPQDTQDAGVIEGVVYQDETVIMVINPGCLLNPAKMRAFQRDAQNLPEANVESSDDEPPLPAQPRKTRRQEPKPEPSVRSVAAAPVPVPAEEKKQPAGNEHGKSRKNRRNLDQTLASEIAGLASEVPPSDGQTQANEESDPGVLPSLDNQ